jgi:DNA primase
MSMLKAEQEWLLGARSGDVRAFYSQIGIELPDRATSEAAVRCFANPAAHNREDRNPSCSVNLATGLWHCQACGRSGNAYHAALAVGYSEQRARELARSNGLFLEAQKSDKPKLPTERQLKKWRQALITDEALLEKCLHVKGWLPRGLVRCGVGWDGERLTFPIRGKRLKLVGLVRYLPGGQPKSKALPGSRRDLFPAPEVLSRKRPVFLVEGEPAAVSVWSCGYQAVGIPGAGSWRSEWAGRLGGHTLIMLPDCDPQGRDLAERMRQSMPGVTVVDIDPLDLSSGDDIGDWIRAGGHRTVGRVLGRLTEWAA